jgi:hypothetical protein
VIAHRLQNAATALFSHWPDEVTAGRIAGTILATDSEGILL